MLGARIGGIPELVLPNRTGMLFTSGSVDSLTEGLTVMSQRDDLPELGRSARAFVEERFAPKQHLKDILTVYEEVTA